MNVTTMPATNDVVLVADHEGTRATPQRYRASAAASRTHGTHPRCHDHRCAQLKGGGIGPMSMPATTSRVDVEPCVPARVLGSRRARTVALGPGPRAAPGARRVGRRVLDRRVVAGRPGARGQPVQLPVLDRVAAVRDRGRLRVVGPRPHGPRHRRGSRGAPRPRAAAPCRRAGGPPRSGGRGPRAGGVQRPPRRARDVGQAQDLAALMEGALLRYRVMAYVTGVALLALFAVAIPLTAAHHPEFGKVLGVAHGVVLYPLYLITIVQLAFHTRLRWWWVVLMALAGVVPVLSFVMEHHVTKEVKSDGGALAVTAPDHVP